MSLSSTTLLVLQKVGAAAHAADAKLKAEVKDYSQRVHDAMAANPDGQKNDALFANWKIVTRLSQAISGIEAELKKLFETAAALGAQAQIAAPKAAAAKALKTVKLAKNTKPTLAKVAKAAVKSAPKPAVAPAAKAKPLAKPSAKSSAKPVVKKAAKKSTPKAGATLGANPTKVLRHLETLLNANDFTVISQTAVSKETGIPLGSMTAATKKLMETGHLLSGPSGSFKLAQAPAAL